MVEKLVAASSPPEQREMRLQLDRKSEFVDLHEAKRSASLPSKFAIEPRQPYGIGGRATDGGFLSAHPRCAPTQL